MIIEIGQHARYIGDEAERFASRRVRIVAAHLRVGDGEDDIQVVTEGEVELTVDTQVEVQSWIEEEGRFSWVRTGVEAGELSVSE